MKTCQHASQNLWAAAGLGDERWAKRALAAGADVDAKIKGVGRTAAMLAARNGHGGCLGVLIGAGADLEAKSGNGSTAAMFAGNNGHAMCLGLLVAAGADVDAGDDDGWTTAMFAASNGHGECVGLLIAAGADLEAKGRDGWSAATIAVANGKHGVAALIDGVVLARREAAELSMAAGGSIQRPGRGSTRM